MDTCHFRKAPEVCANCNDADSYEWDEAIDRRGGKRKGAGRKPKYNEPTITVAFRIPHSKKEQVKKAVHKIIKPR